MLVLLSAVESCVCAVSCVRQCVVGVARIRARVVCESVTHGMMLGGTLAKLVVVVARALRGFSSVMRSIVHEYSNVRCHLGQRTSLLCVDVVWVPASERPTVRAARLLSMARANSGARDHPSRARCSDGAARPSELDEREDGEGCRRARTIGSRACGATAGR